MWDYLEHMAFLLSNIGEVLRVMPRSESNLVRQGLSSASRRYSASDRQRRSKTPRTKSKAVPFVTGDDGRLLPGTCCVCVCCVCACACVCCVNVVCVFCVCCACIACCVFCVCVNILQLSNEEWLTIYRIAGKFGDSAKMPYFLVW